LANFKAILGIDDREDALCRFVLIASSYTIEQYCKRRLFRKKRVEFLPFYGDYVFPLRGYPVWEILAVYRTPGLREANIVEPGLYHTIPECPETTFPRGFEDIPFCLSAAPAIGLVRGLTGLRVQYRAGYVPGRIPADLGSACLELAAWNMSRYRGRRIGMAGGAGSPPEAAGAGNIWKSPCLKMYGSFWNRTGGGCCSYEE
jgi:hypothetical protein